MYKKSGDGDRTGGIGQLILSALDLVLQTLSFAPGGSDLGLHLLATHFGHCLGTVPRVKTMKKWEVGKSRNLRGRGGGLNGNGAKKQGIKKRKSERGLMRLRLGS